MKRILLLLFLMSTVVFSETLDNITYRNGLYTATFKENKRINTNASFDKGQSILALDFQNLKIRNNIPRAMNVKDQFVDRINLTEVAGITSISFYLKKGVEYKILSQNKRIQVQFTKAKEQQP